MLKTSFGNATGDEIILTKLKRQLANLSCKCKICDKYNSTTAQEDTFIENKGNKGEENVQIEDNKIVESYRKETCPGCFVAYNLLRNNNKTFKDQDTETNAIMFSSDKCVQKSIKGIQKTTSMSLMTSNMNSDSDISSQERKICKRNVEKVTFSNDKPKIYDPVAYANCLCLENFIDSIRPPLNY
ncbi:uncharacterized protein LOC123696866 [Colias croceus]|uniref:uncharacterized protein LOC123696866 n=1 Tax=Colias crocea TaxID=72248 RepID=UPI001E27CDEF|nr:uncharacterized protein LOC123696866 [Colias croceus]